jgi:signal-transduction protein with cAMP-binding, CBS, and nucleotidyltransferase domain
MNSGQRTVPAKRVWRGSVEEWQRWQEKELRREGEPRLSALCLLADLRSLHGDGILSIELAELAGERLRQESSAASFRQLTKKAVGMPVALGMFGGFRVERSGLHKGCFDLEQLALDPLVMNVRVLSIASGLKVTGTVERIKRLLEGGRLDVALAERLLMAFHEFGRHKVYLELAGGGADGGLYVNPDDLAEGDRQKVKESLEAVVNLQKIIFQSFQEYL